MFSRFVLADTLVSDNGRQFEYFYNEIIENMFKQRQTILANLRRNVNLDEIVNAFPFDYRATKHGFSCEVVVR